MAKTESSSNPIPRFFPLKSLDEFVGDMEEELFLCPVRSLKCYLRRTKVDRGRPRALFLSPRNPSRSMSRNGISFFIRELIVASRALGDVEGPLPRAHSVRSMATSVAFMKNWSLAKVLEVATWRSQSVFTSFYLRDVASILGDIHSLGPIVSAGEVVTTSE